MHLALASGPQCPARSGQFAVLGQRVDRQSGLNLLAAARKPIPRRHTCGLRARITCLAVSSGNPVTDVPATVEQPEVDHADDSLSSQRSSISQALQQSKNADQSQARSVVSATHATQPQDVVQGAQSSPHIDVQKEWAASVKAAKAADPAVVMRQYFERVSPIFESGRSVDLLDVRAALYGTAKIFLDARQNTKRSSLDTIQPDLRKFLQLLLTKLKLTMPQVDPGAVSNIFWAFANLRVNPDHLVPGMVNELAELFILKIEDASGKSYVSILSACTTLDLNPCEGRLVQAIMQNLHDGTLADVDGHGVSLIAYDLIRLAEDHVTVGDHLSPQIVDALCHAFMSKLQNHDKNQHLSARSLVHFARALHQLRHSPPPGLADAMTARLLEFSQRYDQRPTSQGFTNYLFALANLRAEIAPVDAAKIVHYFLIREGVKIQEVANTTWSLAVLGVLSTALFQQLLDRLATFKPPFHAAVMNQMHQALDYLQSSASTDGTNPQHQEVCQTFDSKLQSFGPRPTPRRRSPFVVHKLKQALYHLGAKFKSAVPIKSWQIEAVVQPQNNVDKPVLIILGRGSVDCFTNKPERPTGRSILFNKVMADEGHLLIIPKELFRGSVGSVAEYIRKELEYLAGGKLDAFLIPKPVNTSANPYEPAASPYEPAAELPKQGVTDGTEAGQTEQAIPAEV